MSRPGVHNAVPCRLCGGKFFPSSLPFHEKSCAKKQKTAEVPCVYCDALLRRDDMEHHLRGSNCPEKAAARLRQKKAVHSNSPEKAATMSGGNFRNAAGSGAMAVKDLCSSTSSPPPFRKTAPAVNRAQNDSFSGDMGGMGGMGAQSADGRIACAVCSRQFSADRVATHQKICRKISNGKNGGTVQKYDASESRVSAIRDQMGLSKLDSRAKGGGKKKSTMVKSTQLAKPNRWGGPGEEDVKRSLKEEAAGDKKSKWRAQHADFQAHIKNAKKIQNHINNGGDVRDLPTMPSTANSEEASFIACSNCGRTFNENAHARHAPLCKGIINKARGPPTHNRYR